MNLANLVIIFADKDKNITKSIKKYFGDLFNVQIFIGNIVQVPNADCVVCPGNSYGFMDDGVEKTIKYIFDGIDERIKNIINNIYYGEQPVGTSSIIETHHHKYKYIAHVPTCRLPSDISSTHNAYTAFRALLTSVLNHNKISDNKINIILCTGFCTGVGQMDPEEAARQMRIAYNLVDLGLPANKENAKLIDDLLK